MRRNAVMRDRSFDSLFASFPSAEQFDDVPTRLSARPMPEGDGRGFDPPPITRDYNSRVAALEDMRNPTDEWIGAWLVEVATEIRYPDGRGCGLDSFFIVRRNSVVVVPRAIHDDSVFGRLEWLRSWKSLLWLDVVHAVADELLRASKRRMPPESVRRINTIADDLMSWKPWRSLMRAKNEATIDEAGLRAAREAVDAVARDRGVWWTRGTVWPQEHGARFTSPFSTPRPTADLDAAYRAVFVVYAAEARATGQRESRATYYERVALGAP